MTRYFIALFLTSAAGIAAAQTTPVAVVLQQYTYAPTGIAPGTTLRLNMANVSAGTSVCTGNLSFINADGTTIKNQNVTVNASQTISYPLTTSDIAGSPSSAVVRGFVKLDRQLGGVAQPAGSSPCTAVTSLEVVDAATGQTRVVLTNPTSISGGLLTPVTGPVPGPITPR